MDKCHYSAVAFSRALYFYIMLLCASTHLHFSCKCLEHVTIYRMSSDMDLGLRFTPQIFRGIQVRACFRPGQVRRSGVHVSNSPLSLLEVALHQERRMHVCKFWIVVVLEDKSGQVLRFCFRITDSFHPDEFPNSRDTEAPPSMILHHWVSLWRRCSLGCTRLHLFSST